MPINIYSVHMKRVYQIGQGYWSMGIVLLNKEGIIRIKGKILSHSFDKV